MSQERPTPEPQPLNSPSPLKDRHGWDLILRKFDEGEIIIKTSGCLLVFSTVGIGAILLVKHLPHIVRDVVEKVKRGKDER